MVRYGKLTSSLHLSIRTVRLLVQTEVPNLFGTSTHFKTPPSLQGCDTCCFCVLPTCYPLFGSRPIVRKTLNSLSFLSHLFLPAAPPAPPPPPPPPPPSPTTTLRRNLSMRTSKAMETAGNATSGKVRATLVAGWSAREAGPFRQISWEMACGRRRWEWRAILHEKRGQDYGWACIYYKH